MFCKRGGKTWFQVSRVTPALDRSLDHERVPGNDGLWGTVGNLLGWSWSKAVSKANPSQFRAKGLSSCRLRAQTGKRDRRQRPHQNTWGPQKWVSAASQSQRKARAGPLHLPLGNRQHKGLARANSTFPSTGTPSSFPIQAEIPTFNPHSPRPCTL